MADEKVKDFYDAYVPRQLRAGVNERHHLIAALAVEQGMRDGMRVLEMGCGVGTLTGLLAAMLPKGKLLAVDLSPGSIDQARQRLAGMAQVELAVADVVKDPIEGHFDMVVLPDVLEHIPLEQHPALFGRLRELLAPEGRVLVHSPDPYYSEWLHVHHPELLQVVDQPLHFAPLAAVVSEAGLAVRHFQRHCIWTDRPDYMAMVLELPPTGHAYRQLPAPAQSLQQRLKRALRRLSGRGH